MVERDEDGVYVATVPGFPAATPKPEPSTNLRNASRKLSALT
jgi:hypothetical protein